MGNPIFEVGAKVKCVDGHWGYVVAVDSQGIWVDFDHRPQDDTLVHPTLVDAAQLWEIA